MLFNFFLMTPSIRVPRSPYASGKTLKELRYLEYLFMTAFLDSSATVVDLPPLSKSKRKLWKSYDQTNILNFFIKKNKKGHERGNELNQIRPIT